MATVKPVIRTQKKRRDGRVPIWLRILDAEKQRFVSTGFLTRPSQWNARLGRVRKTHPQADVVNRRLKQLELDAEDETVRLRAQGKRVTWKHLQDVLRHGKVDDALTYIDRRADSLLKAGNVSRYKRMRTLSQKLRAFAGERLPFDQITLAFLRDWTDYMVTDLGNARTTAGTNLSDLRSIINRAVSEDVIPYEMNPFLRYSIDRGRPERRSWLTYEEVQRIRDLQLEEGSLIWHVRNCWLFAYFAAGIRFSDMANMTQGRIVEGEGDSPPRLVYRMSKTGDDLSIPMAAPAREILSHYLSDDQAQDELVFPLLKGRDLSTPVARDGAVGAATALCPNCHREVHYGARGEAINERLAEYLAGIEVD